MKKLTTPGTITDGVLKIHHRKKFDEVLKTMPNGRVVVTVEKIYNKRTINQNAYYWGVVLELYWHGLQELGWKITKAETHEYLIQRFGKKSITNEQTGEIMDVPLRTSEMRTVEMMEYFTQIYQSASEDLGFEIPEPNEQIKLFENN